MCKEPFEDKIQHAAEILASSQHAVAFTGAGISTASGIPDFRSPDTGLWTQVDPMEVASIYSFQRNPEAFYNWIRPLAKQIMEAQPNAAHIALATLEKVGILQVVLTQNIDDLHYKAGSRHVLELHGSVRQATCIRCGYSVPSAEIWPTFVSSDMMPYCPLCRGLMKPNVVLFGELLPTDVLIEAQYRAEHCDAMLIVGSSLEVYPAAELPIRARQHGAKLISVNYQPTDIDVIASVVIHDNITVALPQIAARAKKLKGIA